MADPIFKLSKLKTWDFYLFYFYLFIFSVFGVDCPVDPLASPPYFLSPSKIYLNESYSTFRDKG